MSHGRSDRQRTVHQVDQPKREWLRRLIIESTVSSSSSSGEEDADQEIALSRKPKARDRGRKRGTRGWDVKPDLVDREPIPVRARDRDRDKVRSKWDDEAEMYRSECAAKTAAPPKSSTSSRQGEQDHKFDKPEGSIFVSFFTCPVTGCSECYGSQDHLSCHVRAAHHNRPSFRCLTCAAAFSFENELDQHERQDRCHKSERLERERETRSTEKKSRRPEKKERVFACRKCSKTFNDRNLYADHYAGVHLNNPKYKCHKCPSEFVMYCNLREHEKKSGHGPMYLTTNTLFGRPEHDVERKERTSSSSKAHSHDQKSQVADKKRKSKSPDRRSVANSKKTKENESENKTKTTVETGPAKPMPAVRRSRSDCQTQTEWLPFCQLKLEYQPVLLPPVYYVPLSNGQPANRLIWAGVKQEPVDDYELEEGELVDAEG